MITTDPPSNETIQGELERLRQACETLSQSVEALMQESEKQRDQMRLTATRMTQIESIIKYSRG